MEKIKKYQQRAELMADRLFVKGTAVLFCHENSNGYLCQECGAVFQAAGSRPDMCPVCHMAVRHVLRLEPGSYLRAGNAGHCWYVLDASDRDLVLAQGRTYTKLDELQLQMDFAGMPVAGHTRRQTFYQMSGIAVVSDKGTVSLFDSSGKKISGRNDRKRICRHLQSAAAKNEIRAYPDPAVWALCKQYGSRGANGFVSSALDLMETKKARRTHLEPAETKKLRLA